jgi:hypothetical protein
METDNGEDSILPPPPRKSFLDRASHKLARTISQIRIGHWLCRPYLTRITKDRHEPVSDLWWCGNWRMSRTHIFLRCTHPKLEKARKDIWDRPDEEGKIMKRPTSVGQLLGKSKWGKRLPDWIMAAGIGLLGCELRDYGSRDRSARL